jgi:NYN domain
MWRKRRSALFVDFENIAPKVPPDALAALIAWLEDGKFDEPGGKRKLVLKRIYWNSSAEKHRATFEAAGFEVVLCEKFSSLKNGADIRMALDIVDTCWKLPDVKEYILFSTDSDFVPVLQRLTEKAKTSAILVNEARMDAHTAFRIYADVLVPLRHLSEALTYTRSKGKLLGALRKTNGHAPGKTPPIARGTATSNGHQTASVVEAAPENLIAQAERAVMRIASRTPKIHVPRKDIEAQLRLIKEFRKTGAKAYLGKRHYQGLMLEVSRQNRRIKVKPGRNLSASVMYVPEE